MEKLKSKVDKLARESGIDLVGVAPVERFAGAPEGHRPDDLLRDARSVVSLAVRIPVGTLLTAPNYSFLQFGWLRLNEILNLAAYRLAILLEDQGFTTMPMPAARDSGAPEIVREEPKPEIRFMGSFSERHAAELAGLGQIGLSGCLITEKFGANVRLGSVVTTAELPPDPLFDGELCLPDKCGYICVRLCPWDAISEENGLSHFGCAAGRSGHNIDHYKNLSELPDLLFSSKSMAYTDSGPTTCAICQIRCPMDPRLTSLPEKLKEKSLLASSALLEAE
jgi:epoxyqueuosine reductase QueG